MPAPGRGWAVRCAGAAGGAGARSGPANPSNMYLLTIVVITTNMEAMTSIVQRELRQKSPPASLEAEVFLALQLAANRVLDPWARYLKTEGLTHGQYNVLRILRGARPAALGCGEIAERMISRDPDITRLLDRLEKQGLVERHRDQDDRRAVRTRISPAGLTLLERLEIPSAMVRDALEPLGRRRLKELNALLAAVIEQAGRLADGPVPSITTQARK